MKRDRKLFLEDIMDSIGKIEEFVSGISFEEFMKDEKTKRAVVHSLEIIGEAAKNVSSDIKQSYQEIPWSDMSRARDKVAHFYFGVDYEIVWKVIKAELPLIKPRIQNILETYPTDVRQKDSTKRNSNDDQKSTKNG